MQCPSGLAGAGGWPENGPYDAIIVTAAADEVPPPLLEQLKPGGRMIIPLRTRFGPQELVLIETDDRGSVRREDILPVMFVPLGCARMSGSRGIRVGDTLTLPSPETAGAGSLEAALRSRRSVREFGPRALPLEIVSQLLWSAQGITSAHGGRTTPSAGALYPLEIDLVSGSVTDLPVGVYRYRAADHTLRLRQGGDLRERLRDVALQQHAIAEAAAIIVIVAVPARSASKYARRAERYIHMEVGHVAQSVCLQAAAMGIGGVVIGAFEDAGVSKILGLGIDEAPIALLPVGYPA